MQSILSKSVRHISFCHPGVALFNTFQIASQVIRGNRASLGKAITLIESHREEYQKAANELLRTIHQLKPNASNGTFRLGISGPPGVGKSTFIESFGMSLIEQGHRVCVLAIDPSSTTTRGSILGDKTRMAKLSASESAYIRPSPSSGILGGVAQNTNDAILLCEAAGFSHIIVETVGVGQSEIEVVNMVDMLALLVNPGGGDDVQGIKKGIAEMADMVLVNKCDGDTTALAKITKNEYERAQSICSSRYNAWVPPVTTVSSLNPATFAPVFSNINKFQCLMKANQEFERRRQNNAKYAMRNATQSLLLSKLKNHLSASVEAREIEEQLILGNILPRDGASAVVENFLSNCKQNN